MEVAATTAVPFVPWQAPFALLQVPFSILLNDDMTIVTSATLSHQSCGSAVRSPVDKDLSVLPLLLRLLLRLLVLLP